jgi:hypothetical protein
MKTREYEKRTLGWLRKQEKKDGFENIRNWQIWKIEHVNKQKIKNAWTEGEIHDIIRKFEKEKGRVPVVTDFDNNPSKYPSSSIVWKVCESWNNAIRGAGLVVNHGMSEEEFLESLIQFSIEYGKISTCADLDNNPKYPSLAVCTRLFGSLEKAKKFIGQDMDSIIKKGIVETNKQKGRQAEIHVFEHDEKESIDLSGENCQNFADGISKDGIYDVKSSKLHVGGFWAFLLDKCVDFYYLLGYDKAHKNLLFKWKIPGDFIDKRNLYIGGFGEYCRGEHNIKNMKRYEIYRNTLGV